MPEVIVIDEIGTELEAQAARTIAERGVQLIGTAHGNNLDNLMLNPTLSDLIGGIQSVTLGDEEARRRRTQKSVLERKAPPTFDVIVEIQDRERVMVHADVGETIDAMLRGDPVAPELRWKDEGGVHRTQSRPRPSPREQLGRERFAGLVGAGGGGWRQEPGWRGETSYRSATLGRGSRRADPLARVSSRCERRLARVARRTVRDRCRTIDARRTDREPRRPGSSGRPFGIRRRPPGSGSGSDSGRRRVCRWRIGSSSRPRRRSSARHGGQPLRDRRCAVRGRRDRRSRSARAVRHGRRRRPRSARARLASWIAIANGATRPAVRWRRSRRRRGPGRSTPPTSSPMTRRSPTGRSRRPATRTVRRCAWSTASCPPSASSRSASAGSGWSRRSASCSCPSSSPATSTRPTS